MRAVARLRSGLGNEPALIDALARLIDPEQPPVAKARSKVAKADGRAGVSPDFAAAAANEPVEPSVQGIGPTAAPVVKAAGAVRLKPAAPEQLVVEPTVLEQLVERADLVVPVQTAAPAPATSGATHTEQGAPAGQPASLFPPLRVRGILREMTAINRATGEPDLVAVVRRVARAEPIVHLPRKRITVLGSYVQWLFDSGPGMLPFAADKQQLAATASRLLGQDRVRIADFIGDPLHRVRMQRQVRWVPLHWPPSGSTLIVVGDLGIGSGDGERLVAAWERFLDQCTRRRLHSVALIPYPQGRWPASAGHFDAALTWDLGTGVQGLRRSRRAGRRH